MKQRTELENKTFKERGRALRKQRGDWMIPEEACKDEMGRELPPVKAENIKERKGEMKGKRKG